MSVQFCRDQVDWRDGVRVRVSADGTDPMWYVSWKSCSGRR